MRKLEDFLLKHWFELIVSAFFAGIIGGAIWMAFTR